MSQTESPETDDPTIADLAESGRRLGIVCHHCNRFRYMRADRFDGSQNVAALARTLKCARCGSREVATVAVARNAKNGYWPAERS